MLVIENLVVGYATNTVLRDISLEVDDGEFLGLIGPNGSGKTTLLRAISGVLRPQEGRLLLQHASMQEFSRRQLAQIIAFLPQDLTLDFAFTVREVAFMGRHPHLSRIGYETRRDQEIVERVMKLTNVTHLADRMITEISGGERQRVLITMCLAQEPKLLILDEPTNHLDIAHQLHFLDLIRKLNRVMGMTVISVFQDLNLAAEYCDRLALLDRGRMEAIGTPEQVLTADMIEQVFGVRVFIQRNCISDKPQITISARS